MSVFNSTYTSNFIATFASLFEDGPLGSGVHGSLWVDADIWVDSDIWID